jgi:signal peptidase I
MREIILKSNEIAELSSRIVLNGGSFCFKAHGWSMYPFIRDGDVLTIQPADPSALKPGDIIFYTTSDNRAVAHRIVGKKNRDNRIMLLLRGDSLFGSDGWIQAEQIIGQVISLERRQKVMRLNRGLLNWITKLWVSIHPIGPWSIRIAGKVKKLLF